MQAVIDKLLINYSDSRQGSKTLLLLHGWGSDQTAFNSLAGALAKNYRVISLDLPGMGKSEVPVEAWDLNAYQQFIYSFITKLKLDKVDAIIGHSNGGALAIKMASDAHFAKKFKLSKLILLGSAGIRTKDKAKKSLFKILAKTGKAGASFLPSSAQLKLKQKLYKAAGSEALDSPHLEETFRLVVGEDVQNQASKIDISTLIIYGKQDADTPPEYGSIFHNLIKNSHLEILEDAGHYVYLDQPERCLSLIEGFLES